VGREGGICVIGFRGMDATLFGHLLATPRSVIERGCCRRVPDDQH